MKRIILTLLVLAMFLPGLACAKILDHAPTKQMEGMENCHGMKDKSPSNGVMLFKDCMKSDLQTASDYPVIKKQVLEKQVFFIPVILQSLISFRGKANSQSTGPPHHFAALSYPPVFLTTLRLRI